MNRVPARIGIIGASGWRAGAYFRIAHSRPDLFSITNALVRTEASAETIHRSWGISATTSFADFAGDGQYDYVIVCVQADLAPELVWDFVQRGVPVLVETPPAAQLDGLIDLYSRLGSDSPVQVAEQYRFQPHHAARLALAASGLLGPVSSVYTSVAHDYHGMSLARAFLATGFETVHVTAAEFGDTVVTTRGRGGWAASLEPIISPRVSARLVFPERGLLAQYEFSGEQYYSPVRSRHIAAFGERGELTDDTVRYMRAPGDAVELEIVRDDTGIDGDLDGSFLRNLRLGDRVVYENPLAPARLSDDEIAIGTAMLRMIAFVDGGEVFYGIADASHDRYLSLLIAEAVQSGAPVASTPQPWSSARSVLGS